MYSFLRIMRIADVAFCCSEQLSVYKLSKIRQGLFSVGWVEMDPKMPTAVPVREHVGVSQPWAGLETRTEELVCCNDSGLCQSEFSFTLCSSVLF